MIVSTFDSGTSYGASVLQYLIWKKRSVKPVVKRGNHKRVSDLIDSIHRKWKYTSGVLTFDISDDPTPEQMEEIMDSFEEFMFAGKARDTFELMWVQHNDKVKTELHFVIPRNDLETHQDLNIAPPGYADQFKVWGEKINTSYGFKNPLKQTANPSQSRRHVHARRSARRSMNKWSVCMKQVKSSLVKI